MAGAIPSAASYGMQGNVRGAALSGLTESLGEGLSGMKFPTMNGSPNNTGLFSNYNQFLPDFRFGQ